MTEDKMDKAVKACLAALKGPDGDPRPVRGNVDRPLRLPADAHEAESHLAWMCEQIPGFMKEGKEEKAQRWLGFVQGSLWAFGLRTIDQMREDNR